MKWRDIFIQISFFYLLPYFLIFSPSFLYGQTINANRILPDPYYPQKPTGGLRLNYYYDRTGRWVKFSDWIPFQRRKFVPHHLEDFYELYGLSHSYDAADIKESIYFLHQALLHKFRHPSRSLCKIKTKTQFHKYRLLLFMHINKKIMRMFLRLGSQYDKRKLYYHNLDFADDLEHSFLIARSYYKQARPFWQKAMVYARQAYQYPFILDIPTIESEAFQIIQKEIDYDRIIVRHIANVNKKLSVTKIFLDKEGRPRPVKSAIQKDIEKMYDKDFKPSPLAAPLVTPEK